MSTLKEVIKRAIKLCADDVDHEEKGGIILQDGDSFKFVYLKNTLAGTPQAMGLWVADMNEFGEKVIPLLTNTCKAYGSFHTHPLFLPVPSSIDRMRLFQGYKYNYIWSVKYKSLCKYAIENGEWVNVL